MASSDYQQRFVIRKSGVRQSVAAMAMCVVYVFVGHELSFTNRFPKTPSIKIDDTPRRHRFSMHTVVSIHAIHETPPSPSAGHARQGV